MTVKSKETRNKECQSSDKTLYYEKNVEQSALGLREDTKHHNEDKQV